MRSSGSTPAGAGRCRVSIPPELTGALSTLIGALTTILLWWGSSRWGPGSYRDDETGKRRRRRPQEWDEGEGEDDPGDSPGDE